MALTTRTEVCSRTINHPETRMTRFWQIVTIYEVGGKELEHVDSDKLFSSEAEAKAELALKRE